MKENVVEETANPEKPAESKKPDRKLGDEWADWDGSRENEYDEPKGRFVLFTLIVWAVAVVGLYVMGYMAGPRLDQWPQALSFIARAFFIALLGGGLIVYALVLLEIVTEKNHLHPVQMVRTDAALAFAQGYPGRQMVRIRPGPGLELLRQSQQCFKPVL